MLGQTRYKKGGEMKKLTLFTTLFKATNIPGTVYVYGDSLIIEHGDRLGMVYEISRIAATLDLTCTAVVWRGLPALQIF